ncbi:MAG: hypothetical protein ACRCX2_28120 [Paraclostridium sp.]
MSIEFYKENIEKVAAESTTLKDFAGGLDPTGSTTFNNAFENEKNHKKHKRIGNAGGFAGGALLGIAGPAAITGAASLALKGKNPEASKALATTAKGTLDALNPKKVVKYSKSLPDVLRLQRDATNVTGGIGSISSGIDKLKAGKLNGKDLSEMVSGAKSALSSSSKLKTDSQKIADKYFDGKSFGEGATRATTALTTLGAAGIGGLTNAYSANSQYNTALKAKKKIKETENKDIRGN